MLYNSIVLLLGTTYFITINHSSRGVAFINPHTTLYNDIFQLFITILVIFRVRLIN